MALIEVPPLLFSKWQKWDARSRTSEEFDVPQDFGILSLYILASADEKPGGMDSPDLKDPAEAIVYIGMSTHVDRRLERSHKGVARYRKASDFADASCKRLWLSVWRSAWNNWSASEVPLATIAFYERALILLYAQKHGRRPKLNLL